MKMLNLILACDKEPWKSVEHTIEQTWGQYIDTFFYYGNGNNTHDDKRIYIDVSEGLNNTAHKTIKCFEYALNNFEFDLIFRTNISSYVDFPLLKSALENIYNPNLYAGVIGKHKDIYFASGAGFAISKKNVEFLVNNQLELDYSLIDDVCVGHALTEPITPLTRYDIDERNQTIDTSFYHYRCKPRYVDYSSFVINTFNKIHSQKETL